MPHKSIVVSVILIAFMTGVFVRSFCDWPVQLPLLFGAVVTIFGIWRPKMFLAGLIVIFCVIGCLYYEFRSSEKNPNLLSYYNGQYVSFIGIISNEVEVQSDHQKITVEARRLTKTDEKISGKILIKTGLYPKHNYGDELEIACEILEPEPIEDFEYDKYLALSKIYSVCYRPNTEKISEGKGSFINSVIFRFKNSLLNVVNKMMAEPQASFLAGLLVGARRGIPDSLMEDFHRTGVTHIIAISGYNITIIASIVLSLTQKYIGRKRAFWLVLAALGFFAILTGAQASVVRATYMGIIVLIARQIGRLSRVGHVIIATAWLITMFNPLALAYDAGFQLSFLATIGLVYFCPIIEPYFSWLTERLSLRESLVSTLSATVLTLPLIVYQFGRLSLVAPLVNLLILPAIPIVMGIGFVSAIAGFASLAIGQLIGWAAWLIMEYIITVVQGFSGLGFASYEIPNLSIIFLILGYTLIFIIMYKPYKLIKK